MARRRHTKSRIPGGGYRLDDGERAVSVAGVARGADGGLTAEIDGRRRTGAVIADGNRLTVFLDGARRQILLEDPGAAAESAEVGGGRLTSPMPGTVVRVLVEAGQAVARDTPLLVLEAMKMEHTIAAPRRRHGRGPALRRRRPGRGRRRARGLHGRIVTDPRDRLIVGLDTPDCDSARRIVERIGDAARFYKIGLGLFYIGGIELARELIAEGCRLFPRRQGLRYRPDGGERRARRGGRSAPTC